MFGLFASAEVSQAQNKRATPNTAQTKTNKPRAPRGTVINEGAIIYQKPDFDSEVIAYAQAGTKLEMSQRLFNGAFHRVRLRPGVLGFIADTDIKPAGGAAARAAPSARNNEKEMQKKKQENLRKKPFSLTQYVGVSYMSVNYREKTMQSQPTANMGFFGMKLFGPNLLLEGLAVSEVNFTFSPSAPSYYEKSTGREAGGFVLLGDFLLQTPFPVGRNALVYVGFGPMFKFSKFDVQLEDSQTGRVSQFSLEDIALGVALNTGIGFRVGPMAARLEAKYHYEYTSYLGFGASLQFGF